MVLGTHTVRRTGAWSLLLAALALILLVAGPRQVLAAAPVWDYVYFPDTQPENAPAGAWGTVHEPGQDPTLAGGRLSFNLNSNAKFYYRGDTLDPNFPTPTLTFEWKVETLSAGYFDMGVFSSAGETSDLIFDGFLSISDNQVLEFFTFFNAGSLDLPPLLGKGQRTYRIVRGPTRADLYVDGVLQATLPASGSPVDEVYLHVASFFENPPNYTALWDHVAYTRGAYTPEELPSPTRGGGDTTAPSATTDLTVTAVSTQSATLAWTAPGDDAGTGTAAAYDVRFTTAGPIATDAQFDAATQASGEPAPQAAGSAETFAVSGLASGTTYYFALKAADGAGNVSALSNSPLGLTAGAGFTLLISSGSDQAGTATKVARIPLTVKVADVLGMAVAGATVTFSTGAAPSGAAGHGLSVISTTTAQDGTAASILTFGNRVGTYTVTATCAGCAPSSVNFTATAELRLVISLSTDSIRPAGTETSPTQPRTTVLVTAAGISFPNDRVADYPVVLVSTPVAFSGGHNHAADRPTGNFEVPGNPSVFTTNTGLDGSFFLSYVSTATGGRELITANSAVDSRVQTATRTVIVEVPGLILLPATTFYTKVGGTALHRGPPAGAIDDNHYGTAAFNAIISSVSAQFKAKFPNRTIRINDMSLPSGGIFDIGPTGSCFLDFPTNTKPCKVWSKPHSFHRRGTSCDYNLDVGLTVIPESNEARALKGLFLKFPGISIRRETDHWHVYLPGGGPL